VRVRIKGRNRFVRLGDVLEIPDGSEIDTTQGVARIVVRSRRGSSATSFATVSGGRAIIDQGRGRRPQTTLRLSEPLRCSSANNASSSQRRSKRRRSLFTQTRGGRFRTRGRHGAAAATGTAWRTTDRCKSTGIRVRDFVRKRTVKVKAGKTYIARVRRG